MFLVETRLLTFFQDVMAIGHMNLLRTGPLGDSNARGEKFKEGEEEEDGKSGGY